MSARLTDSAGNAHPGTQENFALPRSCLRLLLGSLLMLAPSLTPAGPLLEKLHELRAERHAPDTRVLHDLAYGSDPQQRLDVYLPSQPQHAPLLVMVHGGAWRIGDKAAAAVVDNKLARWRPKGFIFVSLNYRLLPAAAPLQQAEDVAKALAFVQQQAASWGGDPSQLIVLGHSAGAHLVSLLDASPSLAAGQGAQPWLGTVVLDSAALDVEQIMQQPHARFYTQAFGTQPGDWAAASPYRQLAPHARPLLLVCSSQRDDSCPQARHFAARADQLGVSAQVLEQPRSHKQINQDLGVDNSYTQAVERFMASLDPRVAQALGISR